MTKKNKALADPYLRSIAISMKRRELDNHLATVCRLAFKGFNAWASTAYQEFAKKEEKIRQELSALES